MVLLTFSNVSKLVFRIVNSYPIRTHFDGTLAYIAYPTLAVPVYA